MTSVELIYDPDCPNVPAARENLLRAFAAAGMTPRWREWNRSDRDTPAHAHPHGSPTVLVDGRDVAGPDGSAPDCCRIYRGGDGTRRGAPPIALIAAALGQVSPPKSNRVSPRLAAVLPAIGIGALPKLVCPACWPAYAGLLGALGVGFINYSPWLLPLTGVFLLAVLATLAVGARRRRGYAPLALGAAAAILMLVGKFGFDSDPATYTGIALLVAASVWNTWPRRRRDRSCPQCDQEVNDERQTQRRSL